MRIAVVIAAYNEAGNIGRLVEETIAAVPEATLQEVIVVDDASDDGTHAEIKALLGRHKALRYLRHGWRAGQSAALRSGVATVFLAALRSVTLSPRLVSELSLEQHRSGGSCRLAVTN